MQIGTILKTDGTTHEIKPKTNGTFALAEMQDAVGGYIELVKLKPGTPFAILIVNEDGKQKQLPYNSKATELAEIAPDDCIVGDALLVANDKAIAHAERIDEPTNKIELLKLSCAMFCKLVDAYVDGQLSERMLIAKLYHARNHVIAAMPELKDVQAHLHILVDRIVKA
jgi:hypothetical protein